MDTNKKIKLLSGLSLAMFTAVAMLIIFTVHEFEYTDKDGQVKTGKHLVPIWSERLPEITAVGTITGKREHRYLQHDAVNGMFTWQTDYYLQFSAMSDETLVQGEIKINKRLYNLITTDMEIVLKYKPAVKNTFRFSVGDIYTINGESLRDFRRG